LAHYGNIDTIEYLTNRGLLMLNLLTSEHCSLGEEITNITYLYTYMFSAASSVFFQLYLYPSFHTSFLRTWDKAAVLVFSVMFWIFLWYTLSFCCTKCDYVFCLIFLQCSRFCAGQWM